MTDFNEQGNVVAGDDLDGPRAWCHIMYTSATVVGAFVFGWPSIIAVIINYATRDRVHNTWLESHWRWQRRTFWFAALWGLIAAVLAATIIGLVIAIPAMVVTGVWVLYRVIRGWLNALERRAMPLPLVA